MQHAVIVMTNLLARITSRRYYVIVEIGFVGILGMILETNQQRTVNHHISHHLLLALGSYLHTSASVTKQYNLVP